ncbi:MAG: DUF445 domain-containing protein [Sphingomonadales bacterium]|nr:DUF445 domain-containing protein [Sphingomonadales bacterium]
MRRSATLLLLAMAVLFVLASRMAGTGALWQWPRAFAEAALVGGLADWFAVTALFRRPLGLPIPHTAIIPENKDRIADTMATFLRTWFLTPQVVARRLRPLNPAALAGAWLADPRRGGEGRVRQGAAALLGEVLQSLDGEQLGGLVKASLRRQAERVELAPLLGQVLHAAIADRRHVPVLEAAIRWAGSALEANEDTLRAMIHARANALLRWTGIDERIANALLDGLYRTLAECLVDPHHPLRQRLEAGLQALADDLRHDAGLRARVEAAKHELLANPAIAAWLDGLWERFRAAMLQATRDPDRMLGGSLGEGLAAFGAALQGDARLQFLVNRFVRRTLVGMVARYGGGIVTLVSDTVRRWDAVTVTGRIEGAVGRDLQFIRINGTLVGGLVGVAIHAVSLWL